MKTLIIAFKIVLLLACFTGKSQILSAQVVSNNLDAFVGTWEYQQGNEVFRVTFIKSKYYPRGSSSGIDCIVGGYYYQKNGIVIANYLNYLPNPVTATTKIVGFSGSADGIVRAATTLGILFVDDPKGGKTSGEESTITLLTPTTARWSLKESEGVYIMDGSTGLYIGNSPPPRGFSVPIDVVLTKQPILLPPPSRPGNSDDETSVIL